MNKYGFFSLIMVVVSLFVFFIMRGPNADSSVGVIILGFLSLVGITFAVMSKSWMPGIVGVLSNGVILAFAFFLFLARGISG